MVRALADYFYDYEAFHGVRSRRSGNNIYIELLLEFNGDKKFSDVQDVINRIKNTLEREILRSSVTIIPCTGKFGLI
ncbi:cation transporter dimerization domain-containing protein [uncultured Methanospirillum sp.]|uniref:cation transporter dimerization domain-containing protein n=1 Tax=uncultured Methanospirillum sp. TaxID=262503 RepID=UPI0029C8698E|nr:cation transporter dimerization domain-containing protein [uncultured Methanospirillum sp.]